MAATAIAAAGLPRDPALDGVDLTPFVTGKDKKPPHERLFWRWGSQAAVLEMPYKLIKLGSRPALLFDISKPEGENHERNLATKHPEIAARLEQKLQAWAAELQPSGLSKDASGFSRHHEELFAEHLITAANAPPRESAKPADGTIQGWLARNGKLTVNDGALVLTPDVELPKKRSGVHHELHSRSCGAGNGDLARALERRWSWQSQHHVAHENREFCGAPVCRVRLAPRGCMARSSCGFT